MKKSKYIKDVSDLKAMTESDLKAYIRGGSKVLQSKIKRLSQSPYAAYSETLEKYNRYTAGTRQIFSGGFGTKGKSYPEMRKMANYINSLISTAETPKRLSQFGASVDKIDQMFQARKFFGAEEAWKDLINNHFDAVKKYVSENIDTWIAYVGSDGVNDVFNVNEYDGDEERYLDLMRRMIVDMRHSDMQMAAQRFALQRMENKTAKPVTGTTRTMRYKGKFKK